jgi:hypothetical protein
MSRYLIGLLDLPLDLLRELFSFPMMQPHTLAVCRFVCRKLWKQIPRTNKFALCYNAAREGDLAVLRWAVLRGAPLGLHSTHWVAAHGDIELLQLLRPIEGWYRACSGAARTGRLDVLQWLRQNGAYWDEETCGLAAEFGHLELLKWAHSQGACFPLSITTMAARGGHLETLRWLLQHARAWPERSLCPEAASRGDLAMLKLVRQYGAMDEEVCDRAALGGHLQLLQWARQNGAPWDIGCTRAAVAGGHMHVLQWAVDNGAPIGKILAVEAAARGNLAILQWLWQVGCPLDEEVCEAAMRGKHAHVLEWAIANMPPPSAEVTTFDPSEYVQ